jgi:hypothetical protein
MALSSTTSSVEAGDWATAERSLVEQPLSEKRSAIRRTRPIFQLIDGAGARTSRIATGAARSGSVGCSRTRRRDGKRGEQPFEICAIARWAGRMVLAVDDFFEAATAAAAFVFVDGHTHMLG